MIEWNDMSDLPECENPHDTEGDPSYFEIIMETCDGKHYVGTRIDKILKAANGDIVNPGFYAWSPKDGLKCIPKVIAWLWLNGSPWHPALQKNLKTDI